MRHFRFVGPYLVPVERQVTIREIQQRVCAEYRIPHERLIGPGRAGDVIRPRHMGMYLAKRLTRFSLTQIARHFGREDHTTVLSAYRKIERERATDQSVDHEVSIYMRELQA